MSSSALLPVSALPADREPLDAATVDRWVWCLLGLGLAARVLRFLLCFPLWDDECFLMVNLIDRRYDALMQPLDYHQVAPLLFLWAERTFIDWFGYNEYAMRAFSFLCGLSSLLLFRHVARRLLSGVAQVAAVGLFAVAYPCIRYSAEAKPYGSDLFAGLVLMALFIEWRRRPEAARFGWALTAVVPWLIGLSYPAAFVAGGLSLWMLPTLRRAARPAAWAAWVAFNVVLSASFLLFYLLATKAQSAAELPFMTDFWRKSFPPLAEPWKLPLWFLDVHAGAWLSYPIGSTNGGSTITFLLILTALVAWRRTGRGALAAFCLLPLGLNLVAAAMHRYPYGGHVKLVHYAAGPICLMTGYGLTVALAWAARRKETLLPTFRRAAVAMAIIGLGVMVRDVCRPQKTFSDARHRDFARWFWFNAEFEGETCCVLTDLKQVFAPEALKDLNWTAMYLCNQKIYSPRRQRNESVQWDRISDRHPLRCVSFSTQLTDFDADAEARWKREMQRHYALAGEETYPFPYFMKNERDLAVMDHLKIYRFVPKGDATSTAERTAAEASDARR